MSRGMDRILNLDDFEVAARRHLPAPIFAYVSGGVERNQSLRANFRAFEDYEFIPRVLVDTTRRSAATTLFGKEWSAPFGIAPMGVSALSAYRGDLVQTQGARAENVPMIMSGSSLIRLEDVAQANPDAWFQAYLPGIDEHIVGLVDRVKATAFQTLVITVDVAVSANRENNVRAGFSTPLRPGPRLAWQGITHPRWLFGTFLKTIAKHGMPHFENNLATRGAPILSSSVNRMFSDRANLAWRHIRLIRDRWPGRLVVKGVLDPRDARLAIDNGADGVIVSNHGGRQLDGSVSPMRVLPAIVKACPEIPVMIDSGFRRGTDVVKALALGAKFVFIGRPFNYAASIGGEAAVRRGIALLREEVMRDMGMLGVNTTAELHPGLLAGPGASPASSA
ncbi:alpha-hydroxy acid oxidase [Ramlibacter sp.]|uniref:alpha-hydroxy acid oxidase n=1 Tax=Ramlibacter sp. TaxID=1917967 RepID=UPI003D1353E9